MSATLKYLLPESEIPTHWVNLLADLGPPPHPPLHPGTKEPLGPLIRHGDQRLVDLVRWLHYALVASEELGITQANVVQMAANYTRPEVQRMLGRNGGLGQMLGVPNDWVVNVIKATGNYGEIFARHLSPIGIQRGPNALWTTPGGQQYAMPFR